MVIEGSPTKPAVATQEPATGKTKPEATKEGEDSDTEFTVETAEMEELDESSSDSEAENEEQELVAETFTIHVENGELKKFSTKKVKKFPAPAADTQESQGIECLANTMDDEDDENDKDFNPCHVSTFHESRSFFNPKPL